MDRSQFRKFLLFYLVLALTNAAAALGPTGYSTRLADAYAAEPAPWFLEQRWALLAIGLPWIAAMVAGLVGLFRLRPWGRSLSLWTTLLTVPIIVVSGPSLVSSVESALGFAATLAWGAVLTIAYLPPVSGLFRAAEDAASRDPGGTSAAQPSPGG